MCSTYRPTKQWTWRREKATRYNWFSQIEEEIEEELKTAKEEGKEEDRCTVCWPREEEDKIKMLFLYMKRCDDWYWFYLFVFSNSFHFDNYFSKIIWKQPNFNIKSGVKNGEEKFMQIQKSFRTIHTSHGANLSILPSRAKQRPWALCHERKWKMPKGKSTFALELHRWSCWFCV